MRRKKVLILCLTLLLIVVMTPVLTMSVANAEDTDISSMNALDALGIDTSSVPEGVDLDSTDNPYGRNTATVNPVYELFLQGDEGSILYGHNKPVGVDFTDFLMQTDERENVICDDAASATASGNFINDASGNKGQTVTVAAGSLSEEGGLFIYFSDPINDIKGSDKTILAADEDHIIGNTGNQMTEDFTTAAYLMQNYLQISTGDYDGDGIDEVAVYVPQQGSSRVEIYDLQIDDTFNEENASTYYMDTAHWARAWTYYYNENPFVSNMVSLSSGDITQDGTDDLVLTWGYYYGPTKYTNSKAVVLYGSKTAMLQNSKSIPLSYDDSPIIRAAFTIGDVDSDNVDDLILGGQLNSDIEKHNINSRFVAIYTYNGETDTFIQSVAQNFDLFSKNENGEYVYAVMADHHNMFLSLPTMVTNVAALNMRGPGYAANIYIDSLIIEYDEGLDIVAALDQNPNFNRHADIPYPFWIRPPSQLRGRYYSEYQIVTGDFTGDGKETLQTMMYYAPESYTSNDADFTIPTFQSWWLWYWLRFVATSETLQFDLEEDTIMTVMEGVLTEEEDPETGVTTGYSFDVNALTKQVNFATSFCKLNSDNDTSYISYTGEHGVLYSDPKVLAVIASPPYFEDLSSDALSGSYMESSTSYASTTGEGSEETKTNTLSIGAYVSFSHDFEVFGVKIAGMETELAYKHGWTWETQESSMMEMTVAYETVAGQDSVAFYSIPMEYYVYDSYMPIIDSDTGEVTGYDKQKMSVNLPHTAAVVVLSLDKYEKIAADYAELPAIAGTALTHTVGEPATYPASSSAYSNAIKYDGNWAGVDYSASGASVSQEIAITEENGSGLTNTDTLEFKIGAGPGDFIFGVSAGYEHGSSKVTVTSEGSTYAGTVYNMPAEAEECGYYYAWKLFTYTYTIGGSNFPVVNYLVKDVTAPPFLPSDFTQDSTLTTDEAIGLTWSYPSANAISGFQIYRYYEFPDGSGSYELAFIPASQVDYTTIGENGGLMRHYQFVDQNLADYTDYDYQIQVVRAAVPLASIISDVLTARTKADKGYPTINLNGVTTNTTDTYDEETGEVIGTVTDYSLLVYPDTSSTVSVSIAESYAQTPRYQWQKLGEEGWENIAGATSSSYTFSQAGVSDEGRYRCRVNVIYEDGDVGQIYYISAYSDDFTLDYSMRSPKVVEDSFAVDIDNDTVFLSLKSSHTNHTFSPTGNVTFIISGADYNSSYTVKLGDPSAQYVTTAILDLGDTDHDGDGIFVDLPDGVYAITAYYSGSRVFSSLVINDPVYYVAGNSSGYLLNVDSSYTYGEDIVPELMYVSINGSQVVANQVSSGITYKVFEEQCRMETATYSFTFDFGIFGSYTFHYTFTYPVYEYVEQSGFVLGDGSITARSVGEFRLKAYIDDEEVASSDFNVLQKDITIGFNNPLTGVAGNASIAQPTYSDLKVISENQLVSEYGDTLANLGLIVESYNTAGSEVMISPSTDPGLYTIIGAPADPPSEDYGNYNITYVSSTYILTGPKYDMTIVAALFGSENAIVGTVSVIDPEVEQDDGSILEIATTPTDNIWYYSDLFTGGTAVTFRAAPQTGYQVKSWTVTTDHGTTTTETNSKTFAYQTTANNTTVTVQFELAKNRLYFQSANPSSSDGTVTAVGNAIQSGALVQPNAEYTFMATPSLGYHFEEWTLAGSTNSNFLGDYDEGTGISTTPLTMGTVDTVLSAVFARDSYLLILEGYIQATYEIDDGFGNMVPVTSTGTVSIPGDTEVTVSAQPGYSLDSGYWYVNSDQAGSTSSCTFIMTQDTTVGRGTSLNNYTVSVSVDQPPSTTHNTVVTKINNAVADFSAPRSVSGGTSLTFTAMPAWGYVFDHWQVNGTASSETSRTLTISPLGENLSVVAYFVANPDNYTVHLSNNAGGGLTYSVLYQGSGYAANAPLNAMSDPAGTDITVYDGDTLTVTAHPNTDYMLRSWTVGNDVDESPGAVLTLEDISENMTVAARFIPMSFSAVTYTAGLGGSITSATTNGVPFSSGDLVGNGSEVVITAVPEGNMMVSYWTIDGETVKTDDNTIFIDKTLTIDSLAAGSTMEINVYFTALSQYVITYDLTNITADKTYTPADYVGKTSSTETTDYVLAGSKIEITVSPIDDHRITSFTVGGESGTENEDGTWSYTLNEVTSNLDVVAVAAELFDLEINAGILNGEIGITTKKEEGRAIAGETITLTTISPNLDYTFDSWSYNGNTVSGTTFTMPDEDTTVSAVFTPINTVDIYYSVYDINGTEAGGLNGTVTAEVDRTYDGGDTVEGYPVSDTDGFLTVHRGYDDQYVDWPDSEITFAAEPNSGYMVKYWYLDGEEVTADTENCTFGSNTLTFTVVEDAEADYDIKVQYELIGDKIIYYAGDAYGTITGAILTSNFGESTQLDSGDTLTISGTITFTAAPINDGYQVEGWYVNGIRQAGETDNTYLYTATAGTGAIVTVRFERVSYTVTYGGDNGSVTAEIDSDSIGESPALVVGDSQVTFEATAEPGYAFYSWTIDGDLSDETSDTLTLTIIDDTTVTANFIEDANCVITFNVSGDGGTLTATKGGSTFLNGSSAAANDVIVFTATPETVTNGGNDNYQVVSWNIGGSTIITSSTTYQLTVSAATTVTVTFERYDWQVTYGVTGENGTISAKSGSLTIDSLDRVATGTDITFTATPDEGYQVKSWTVDGIETDTEDTTYTVNHIDDDITVMVEFEAVPAYTITITTSGTGYGSVTAKVNDGDPEEDAVTVEVYRHGTVTLTAMRYNESNAFNGWTVPDDATCTVAEDGIVLTLSDITGDITIDAAFTPATMFELSASEDDPNGTLDYDNVQVGYRSADLMNTVDLSSSTSVQVTCGMDVVIEAIPEEGYMVCGWFVNGVEQDELSHTLILSEVSVDTHIEVTFEPIVTYGIPSSGDNYKVTSGAKIPDDVGRDTEIRDRGTVTFSVLVDEGCYFSDLEICGVDCLSESKSPTGTEENIVSVETGEDGSYIITVTNVRSDIDYTIKAVKPQVDIVTPTNGAIAVTYQNGSGSTITVVSGDEIPVGTVLTISALPDSGYYLKAWGDDLSGKTGSVVTLIVTEKELITISAQFSEPLVTVYVPDNGSILVTYVNELSETITLADTSTAAEGVTELTFNIPVTTVLDISATADNGYVLSSWSGSVSGRNGYDITYTVPGSDAIISASFKAESSGGGGLSGGGSSTFASGVVDNSSLLISYDVDGGTIYLNLTNKLIKDLYDMGMMEKGLEFDLSEISRAKELILPTDSGLFDAEFLTVSFPALTMTFEHDTLAALSEAANSGDISITGKTVNKSVLTEAQQEAVGDSPVYDITVLADGNQVSQLGGEITLSIPYTLGANEDPDNITVWYLKDDGSLAEMACSYDEKTGAVSFVTDHLSYYAVVYNEPSAWANHFSDILSGAWYYDAVEYICSNGLMTGVSDSSFDPSGTTTRAMVVTVLWRLAGEPVAGESDFRDVADGAWYTDAVTWAAENGIVNGMGDGLFIPDDSITREQLAVILYNYAGFMGYDQSAGGDTSVFSDADKISSWASDAMKWAVGSGMIGGKGGGILDPSGSATRAEIATILMRFIEKTVD